MLISFKFQNLKGSKGERCLSVSFPSELKNLKTFRFTITADKEKLTQELFWEFHFHSFSTTSVNWITELCNLHSLVVVF